MSKTRILTLMIAVSLMFACMTTANLEEAGTAAPPTAPLPDAPTAREEEPAGEVFQVPYEWLEPQGYDLCAVVVADEALHLRRAPSENAEHILYLLAGEQVILIDPAGDWWKVRTISGSEGYARAKYLQERECQ